MEEEKLFEFRFEQDDEYLRDYLKYAYFGMPARKAVIAIGIFAAAAFIGLAVYYTAAAPYHAWKFWLIAVLFAAFNAWSYGFRYFKSVKSSKKRKEELYGDKPVFCEGYVTDSEIRLLNTASNGENTIALSTLAKVRETKALIVLITTARMYHVLSKKGFSKGTPVGFVEFLREKGVK